MPAPNLLAWYAFVAALLTLLPSSTECFSHSYHNPRTSISLVGNLRSQHSFPKVGGRTGNTKNNDHRNLYALPNGKIDMVEGNDSDAPLMVSKVSPLKPFFENPIKSVSFSVAMITCGAVLGPFLDTFHSTFNVLQYDQPFTLQLWSTNLDHPALITTWWVPPLFGLAGFIIGWLYVLLDHVIPKDVGATTIDELKRSPTVPFILKGISLFTFQYWLSGVLFAYGVDRTIIFWIMTAYASVGYWYFDKTIAGFITSLATAIGGPLIEVGLISTLAGTNGGYHYTDVGETGFFPLWIVPVYFLGGPANGNLAFGFWNALDKVFGDKDDNCIDAVIAPCEFCNDTRTVPCPNCDGQGYYVTYGEAVTCNCCKGTGLVICKSCFDRYDEDPADLEGIRELMVRLTADKRP